MTDLHAIAARHVVIDGHCQGDGPGLPCDVVPLLDELAALRSQRDLLAAAVVALADIVNDVRDSEPGRWEHYDNHCDRDNWCCIGHVEYGMQDAADAIALARSIEP